MAHTSVPIIDMAPFLEGTVTGKRHVAAQVGRACEEIGFLTIVGHGVPADLVQRTYDVSRRFFDLPLAEKLKVRVNSTGVGYVPLHVESLAATDGHTLPRRLHESRN